MSLTPSLYLIMKVINCRYDSTRR